jgi:RNA-directed DNA polymerase
MRDTAKSVDEAEQRGRAILSRLGLELHPEKTRRVELGRGLQGLDFLGCHLRKRMSGPIWARSRRRVYFLQCEPSPRSMKRVRQRVKEIARNSRRHEDMHTLIGELNPVLRGWGNYFRTGNAARKFLAIDEYDRRSSADAAREAQGSEPPPRRNERMAPRLLRSPGAPPPARNGPLPGGCVMRGHERPSVSRVREIRTHGLNGGLPETAAKPVGE